MLHSAVLGMGGHFITMVRVSFSDWALQDNLNPQPIKTHIVNHTKALEALSQRAVIVVYG